MKRSKEFENILDDCLERLFGGETIEACLESYPEQADELRPLLETVADARNATDITPRPEFRQQAALDFQTAIREMPVKKTAGSFSLRHWWVTVVTVFAVVVLGGGGAGFAAGSSLPDSPLYPVKLATESVRIAFAFSGHDKAELYAEFTGRRVDEIIAMAAAGKLEEIEEATDLLGRQLIAMADIFAPSGGVETAMEADEFSAPAAEAPMLAEAETAPVPAPQPSPGGSRPEISVPAPPGLESARRDGVPRGASPAQGTGPGREDGTGGIRSAVAEDAMRNNSKLEKALATAPESVKEILERAIAIASRGYEQAIRNMR